MTETETQQQQVSTLGFVDTETTSLAPNRRIWNIGVILRPPFGAEIREEIIIRRVDLTHADMKSLDIGHFWQRHPSHGGDPGDAVILEDERDAAWWLMERTRPVLTPQGALPVPIVGAVPHFDVWGFTGMLERAGLPWPGHYHPIDAEAVAVGALAARGINVGRPPYDSAELSKVIGLDLTTYRRHTALGDAHWAMDLFDAALRPIEGVTGRASLAELAAAAGG